VNKNVDIWLAQCGGLGPAGKACVMIDDTDRFTACTVASICDVTLLFLFLKSF
jgi:hypothetical protein